MDTDKLRAVLVFATIGLIALSVTGAFLFAILWRLQDDAGSRFFGHVTIGAIFLTSISAAILAIFAAQTDRPAPDPDAGTVERA